MSTLRTRTGNTTLTHAELDANFKRTVTQKTDTYQIVISDNRSVIEANKATPFTITLPPVATADNSQTGDYEVTVTNIGAGIATVDGSGAETIDGSADLALQQWASATFVLDSAQTGWKSVARSNVLAHTGALTVSGALTATGALTASGGVDGVLGGVTPAAISGTTGGFSGALTASGGVDGVLGGVTPAAVSGTTGSFSGEVTGTGFTGTLDGILGGGTPAAATVTTVVASGVVSVDDTTDSTSGTTGSIHTDGGIGAVKDIATDANLIVAGTATITGSLIADNVGSVVGSETSLTSGSSSTISSIPSGVKFIKVCFEDVQPATGAAGQKLSLRLGDSGGIETTGYAGGTAQIDAAPATTAWATGNSIYLSNDVFSSSSYYGVCTLTLKDATNHTWMVEVNGYNVADGMQLLGAGRKDLTTALTQIELTLSGAGSFGSGTWNIVYSK